MSFCELEVSKSGEVRVKVRADGVILGIGVMKSGWFFAKNRRARLDRANRRTENEIIRGSLNIHINTSILFLLNLLDNRLAVSPMPGIATPQSRHEY